MLHNLLEQISNLKILSGGAVAEWSKALHSREKINENQKDPKFAPRPGQPLKNPFNRTNVLETKY